MVLSNDSILLETSRTGVIVVATVLRYWHEKVLYGGTTAVGYYDTLHYTPHGSAAYMSTSGIEQVSAFCQNAFGANKLLVVHMTIFTCCCCKFHMVNMQA